MKEKKRELRRALSRLGYCSRKDAEFIIQEGRVTVDGKKVTNYLEPVFLSDDIRVDGKPISTKEIEIYAFHKPQGVITTMDKFEERPKVADFMPTHKYLFPVGRLDKASRGLLILTNDNDFADYILAPKTKLQKTYRVQIKGRFHEPHIKEMERGIFIERVRYRADQVNIWKQNPRTTWLEIKLTEGKNRQIRRMLEALRYDVLELIRIQIGNLKLGNLQPGEYKRIGREAIL